MHNITWNFFLGELFQFQVFRWCYITAVFLNREELPVVVFSIIATFVGKGLLLPVVAYRKGEGLIFSKVAMWMGLNLVPQFLYVSKYQLKLSQPRLQFSFCPF
mgnify:CR=1 FL=1